MKKIIGILIAVMMVVTLAATFVSAEQEIIVKLDDVKIDFADVKPQIINGRTMVPLRAIFEALGATVEWDDATKTVKSEKGDIYVALTIGEIELRKNWQTIELDVPAQIIDSRTMVPVRAISEAFECEVNWDDATKTVLITSPKEEEKNEVIKTEVLRWDFDNDGDLAGFSGGNVTLEAKNGFLNFSNPTTPDITANRYGMSLDASICDEVRIGIKGVSEAMGKDGAFFQMFFTTDTNPSMNEERSFKEKYSKYKYTDGEVFEIVIDLKSNKFWTDTVKILRIDPYNSQNETAIDYIAFYTVEGGDQAASNKADILRWDFNSDGDLSGFSEGNVTLEAKNGFLNFNNPTTPDITAYRYGMSLNAAECTEVRIGIKGVSEAMGKDGAFFQMFFTTDTNPSMSEERSYKEKYTKYRYTDGEVFEIVIDLTANKFWSDTVKMIRIDPYNAQYETAIDYIVFRG